MAIKKALTGITQDTPVSVDTKDGRTFSGKYNGEFEDAFGTHVISLVRGNEEVLVPAHIIDVHEGLV